MISVGSTWAAVVIMVLAAAVCLVYHMGDMV